MLEEALFAACSALAEADTAAEPALHCTVASLYLAAREGSTTAHAAFGVRWVRALCESFAHTDDRKQARLTPAATAGLAWLAQHAAAGDEDSGAAEVGALALRQVVPKLVPSPLLTTLEGLWGLCHLAATAPGDGGAVANVGDLLLKRLPAGATAVAGQTSSEEAVMRGLAKLRLQKDVADLEQELARSKAAEAAARPSLVVPDGASLAKHVHWLRAVREGPALFVTQAALTELDALKMGLASDATGGGADDEKGSGAADASASASTSAMARQAQAAIAWLEASVAHGQQQGPGRSTRGARVVLEQGEQGVDLLAACEAQQPGAALMTDNEALLAEAQQRDLKTARGDDAKRWWRFEHDKPRSGGGGRGRGRGQGLGQSSQDRRR